MDLVGGSQGNGSWVVVKKTWFKELLSSVQKGFTIETREEQF
jgi:hypothetical protein